MRIRTGTVLLVLATCVGAQSAVAQTKPGQRGPTSFGIVGGLNLAKLTGDGATGVDTRTAFYAGAAVTVPLGTNLFFQPQALYSLQGFKGTDSGVTGTFALDYVQIPVFLGLRVPMQGNGMRPYVMAGPYVGLKVGCKIKVSGGGISGSVNCDDPSVGLDTKSTDFGLAFGAGVEVPMGGARLALGARFSMGLGDVADGYKARNSVISLGGGIFFGR
jgi:hypothetical protein